MLAFYAHACYYIKALCFGSLVKRLRRRPLTAETAVRFRYELRELQAVCRGQKEAPWMFTSERGFFFVLVWRDSATSASPQDERMHTAQCCRMHFCGASNCRGIRGAIIILCHTSSSINP